MTTSTRRRSKRAVISYDDVSLPMSGRVYGPVRVLAPMLRRLGCPWQYNPGRHCYLVPKARLNDVLAAIELDGHVVESEVTIR